MDREQLEFSISQYLDGTLSAAEQAALEERLKVDTEARQILAEYRSLNELVKSEGELPLVEWGQLSANISAAITNQEGQANLEEEFEYSLSRYMDGESSTAEKEAIEARLGIDASARLVLNDYRSLDRVMKQSQALPAFEWDVLAEHLSGAVSDQIEREKYSITARMRFVRQIAVAACLAIAAGVAIYVGSIKHGNTLNSPIEIVDVIGPDQPSKMAIAELTLADEPESVANSRLDQYSPGVVSMPARVQLAESVPASYPDARSPF